MDSEIPSLVRVVARALYSRYTTFKHRVRTQNPKRILIASHLRLGDAILMTALLAKVREHYPNAEIVLITSIAMAPIYSKRPYDVTVWPYHPRHFQTAAKMFEKDGFDLAIVPGNNRYGWLAAALRSKWIVAHAEDSPKLKSWLIDELVPYPTSPAAISDIFTGLVPGPLPQPYQPCDWPAPDCKVFDMPSKPYAVLHVGASTPLKFWQPEKWQALADWFESQSIEVVLSGGDQESAVVQQVDPHQQYRSYAGKLDLSQMWHLISNASIFISPDTGVAHLARLTGTPSITLFGPGSAFLFGRGQFWSNAPSVEVTIENFPCRDQDNVFNRNRPWIKHCFRTQTECSFASCMQAIDAIEVIKAAERLLGHLV